MKFLVLFYLLFSTYCYSSSGSDEQSKPVEVIYELNGKEHKLLGTDNGSYYQFNESSEKVLNVATLDWPPYIGEGLCNKGWVFQLAVAVLVNKGYQVNVHFFPWARSVKMAESGEMDILFPEYFIEDSAPSDVVPGKKRKELLALSNKFPGGDLSLIKRKGDPFLFDGNLAKLKGKAIGVVRGYQNTPEFDAMMDAGLINVVSAVDELQLAKLLLAKRVKLVVGDPKVFQYSINYSSLSNANKQALLDGIEAVTPSLKYNHLYFAISNRSKHWRYLIDDINLSILEFDQQGETNKIIAKGSGCIANFLDI